MKTKFNFIEIESILSVVVVLVVMVIGVFVIFTILPNISNEKNTSETLTNISNIGIPNTIFNLLPIVFIVAIAGMIMSVVGGFARGGSDDDEKPIKLSTRLDKEKEKIPVYEPIALTYKDTEKVRPVKLEEESEETLKNKLENGEITTSEYNTRMMKIWFQKK